MTNTHNTRDDYFVCACGVILMRFSFHFEKNSAREERSQAERDEQPPLTEQWCGALFDCRATRMRLQELLDVASVVSDDRSQFGYDGHQAEWFASRSSQNGRSSPAMNELRVVTCLRRYHK